jgi:hypothetical protein
VYIYCSVYFLKVIEKAILFTSDALQIYFCLLMSDTAVDDDDNFYLFSYQYNIVTN